MLARPVYQSKIDPWALPLLAIVPLVPAVAALLMHAPVAYVSFFVVSLLYLVFLVPVTYRLEPETLVIRSGVLRWRIPYAQMRSVRPTRNALAAPALSLDRLELCFGAAGRALLSPSDQQTFLADLHAHAPHLYLPPVPDSGKP